MVILAVFSCIFIGIFVLVRYLESASVFYPSSELILTPADVDLPYVDVFVETLDGAHLNGWFVKNSKARHNLLYLHGNAGNISGRVDKIKVFHDLGFNVFIIDYRGYGKSTGRPSESGVYQDALAAFDYLQKRADVGKLPVVVYGASIGGAVAIDLASKRKPVALVVESTFTSARDLARIYYPWAPSFMMSLRFDSIAKIKDVSCPKLFFHSRGDEIVPFEIGQKLFNAASNPKEFVEVKGGHNDNFMLSEETIRHSITGFLNKFYPQENL